MQGLINVMEAIDLGVYDQLLVGLVVGFLLCTVLNWLTQEKPKAWHKDPTVMDLYKERLEEQRRFLKIMDKNGFEG